MDFHQIYHGLLQGVFHGIDAAHHLLKVRSSQGCTDARKRMNCHTETRYITLLVTTKWTGMSHTKMLHIMAAPCRGSGVSVACLGQTLVQQLGSIGNQMLKALVNGSHGNDSMASNIGMSMVLDTCHVQCEWQMSMTFSNDCLPNYYGWMGSTALEAQALLISSWIEASSHEHIHWDAEDHCGVHY